MVAMCSNDHASPGFLLSHQNLRAICLGAETRGMVVHTSLHSLANTVLIAVACVPLLLFVASLHLHLCVPG